MDITHITLYIGFRLDSGRIGLDSDWIGFRLDSDWIPIGFRLDSFRLDWSPIGFRLGSDWAHGQWGRGQCPWGHGPMGLGPMGPWAHVRMPPPTHRELMGTHEAPIESHWGPKGVHGVIVWKPMGSHGALIGCILDLRGALFQQTPDQPHSGRDWYVSRSCDSIACTRSACIHAQGVTAPDMPLSRTALQL